LSTRPSRILSHLARVCDPGDPTADRGSRYLKCWKKDIEVTPSLLSQLIVKFTLFYNNI
jgi:hypothetical protein